MKQGYVSLVLHGHMPFVRHPDIDDALEERWFFEAMHECYIPLIRMFESLTLDDIKFKITMSLTPPLMSMLNDEYLNKRFDEHMQKLIELSEKEILRTKNDKYLNTLSYFYNDRFNSLYSTYKSYDKNLINAFRKFKDIGCLEIITCSATHAFLPLMMINPEAVKAQLATAVQSYYDLMDETPKGIWLPECAYTYTLDNYLKDIGIRYFISESNAVLYASPKPQYGTFAPISTPRGVCAFPRDMESSSQVWSNVTGYPGDNNYREFYKDIGYELPMDYISPYINSSGIRIDTGVKYYRITGRTDHKELYMREWALDSVHKHAKHFRDSRVNQINTLANHMDKPPIIICPYDAELFGHWWFEGPEFIENFIRESAKDGTNYSLVSPYDYLKDNPVVQCSTPSPSSWGENSDYSVWLNASTHWIYKDLHQSETLMTRLANTYKEPSPLVKRALNQAARELMLAEASDWPFIIKHNTTVNYAIKRINKHLDNFSKLYESITKDRINESWLRKIEDIDNIFPNINYAVYKTDAY